MIVREVLQDRKYMRPFDYFNDAKDTICWLKGVGTPEALALADELQVGYDDFIKQWNKRLMNDNRK